jgi:hypothetical protein
MFCWPCLIVYQYSDWPCLIVYQYSDWPCLIVYQYSDWPCLIVYQYTDWPCLIVYQYSDWPCLIVYQYTDWPCLIVYQYTEANVMHILFNLLRINASKRFEYYLLILRRRYTSTTLIRVQPTDITRTQYTRCRLYSTSWGWASNARNM